MAKRITVVISQGQSANPAKRDMEENLVASLLMESGIDVVVVPHLYDLQADGTGVLALQGLSGPVIVLSWLFERATRWTLDRHGIRGTIGKSLITSADESDESGDDEEAAPPREEKLHVIDQRPTPNRPIYCLDLRVHSSVQPYLDEVRRIRDENRAQVVELTSWIGGTPKPDQLQRFMEPVNNTSLAGSPSNPIPVVRIEEVPDRRWYPVIDYSRCTNCMECIDFCLFGVYGVDRVETILVEQPDNCRKGCPACSRVCPENAIIFPQHKTPAIAGADVGEAGGLKIDLSKLFGAPETSEDAVVVAARERDEQLMLAGRAAVGLSVGIPKRQMDKETQCKDELDSLIDALDSMDL